MVRLLFTLMFFYALSSQVAQAANISKCLGESDSTKAIDLDSAIRMDPNGRSNWISYYHRARIYLEKGDIDKALESNSRAASLLPSNYWPYLARSEALAIKGDYEHAAEDIDRAARNVQKLDDGNAHVYRGQLLSQKGEFRGAIREFTKAIENGERTARAFVGRGLALEKAGDVALALDSYRTATTTINKEFEDRKFKSTALARIEFLDKLPEQVPAVVSVVPSKNVTAVVSLAPKTIVLSDRRIALVIGNSAYQNVSALPNPECDAKVVADILKRVGFETVTLQTNLEKEALVAALRSFAKQAETADWALVYYAGHGMEVAGINYLVPVDARIAADRDIGFEAVPLEQVLNAADRAKKLRLVILDACRDNPFAKQMKRTLTATSRSISGGLVAVEPEAGTLVVYAAKDGETALDGDGANSPFTSAFVKNVLTPKVEVRRLFDFVRDDVMEATNGKQRPFSYGSISGRQDFYFVTD
jgi:hypothetical protein